MGLTVLAVLAVVTPAVWLAIWRIGVLFLAVLAPLLGIGRTARSVSGNSVETEFARWFQPLDADPTRERWGSPVEPPRGRTRASPRRSRDPPIGSDVRRHINLAGGEGIPISEARAT